jgi:hypothetical protein
MQPDPRFLMAYCERLGQPAFWAEPLNAITNAAFLVAAFGCFWLWRRAEARDWAVFALMAIVVMIGIGSFLFHTIPNRITVLMDVLPIQAFILLYFGLALRRFLGLPIWVMLAGPILFFVASAGLVQFAGSRALGGGIGYVPALVALFGFGLVLGLRQDDLARRRARGLIVAGAVFAVSLALRTLDLPFCGSWRHGLHFLWHVLNATVLGLLLLVAMGVQHQPRPLLQRT